MDATLIKMALWRWVMYPLCWWLTVCPWLSRESVEGRFPPQGPSRWGEGQEEKEGTMESAAPVDGHASPDTSAPPPHIQGPAGNKCSTSKFKANNFKHGLIKPMSRLCPLMWNWTKSSQLLTWLDFTYIIKANNLFIRARMVLLTSVKLPLNLAFNQIQVPL